MNIQPIMVTQKYLMERQNPFEYLWMINLKKDSKRRGQKKKSLSLQILKVKQVH